MPSNVLGHLTSTVGLVSSLHDETFNVMSAEWTYFVAREPLHIAVGIADYNWSQSRIASAGEFSVTLCDASQAALAVFAGSVSGVDVDKATSTAVELAGPVVGTTPHVRGGVLNAECQVRHLVDLPGYVLVIGEAVWWRHDEEATRRPLVKHGGLHELGERIADPRVITAARMAPDGTSVRVVASAYGPDPALPWSVRIVDPDDEAVLLDTRVEPDGTLLDGDFPLARPAAGVDVRVARGAAPAGTAHCALPQAAVARVG